MRKKIVFDCERMKYPNTGLYSYCNFLGDALMQNAATNEDIFFYANDLVPTKYHLPNRYIKGSPIDKLFFNHKQKFDIWHATHQEASVLPKSKTTKLVLTIHDINFMHDSKKSDAKKKAYLSRLAKKVAQSDHLVFISQFVANDMSNHFDIAKKPYSIIYNGADLPKLQMITEPKVKPTTDFIFALGLITEKKNFHVLPSLLCNNNYQLVIGGHVGDTKYKEKIITESRKLNVIDRVLFTEAVSENDKQWYYSNCLAFAFPSLAEGFGLPVLEAMHFGKPVFLSRKTSLPEIGKALAFYFDAFDPQAMRDVFENGMKAYTINNMSSAIQKHASDFVWNKTAQQYLAVYRSLY